MKDTPFSHHPEDLDKIPGEGSESYIYDEGSKLHSCGFPAFNTGVTIEAYGDFETTKTALEKAVERCRYYERAFSRTLPHSDVSRLNDAFGEEVEILPETYDLLLEAQRYCLESQGCFDVTIGAISRKWDFHRGKRPSARELESLLAHVDWRNILLRMEGSSQAKGRICDEDGTRYFARLKDPHAALDLGGIAKGYIADRLVELLCECGLRAFLVNLGGNVAVLGPKPDGSKWLVGIRDPRDGSKIMGALPLTRGSVVTSGVYERSFSHEGALLHHILDPRTGYPVQTDVASVSVVAASSLDAEGYSTTLLALGLEKGAEFARRTPLIRAAYFIDDKGTVKNSHKERPGLPR